MKHEEEKGGSSLRALLRQFFRQLALPEGANMDAAKASFKNGMLEIEMPVAAKKAEAVRRLKIEAPEKELVGA
jgi:HSP20 family molecular chaperone IbpA